MATKDAKAALMKKMMDKKMGKCPDCGKKMKDCECEMDGMGGPGYSKIKRAMKNC